MRRHRFYFIAAWMPMIPLTAHESQTAPVSTAEDGRWAQGERCVRSRVD
jgi:hypothetical protein